MYRFFPIEVGKSHVHSPHVDDHCILRNSRHKTVSSVETSVHKINWLIAEVFFLGEFLELVLCDNESVMSDTVINVTPLCRLHVVFAVHDTQHRRCISILQQFDEMLTKWFFLDCKTLVFQRFFICFF